MCYIDKIKVLRKQHKHSQKDMAELLQTTQQQYSKYENLQQELPIRHLITICKHYGISADWLLGLNETNQNDYFTYVTPNFDNQVIRYHKQEAFDLKREVKE